MNKKIIFTTIKYMSNTKNINLFQTVEFLHSEAKNQGIKFSSEGYPILHDFSFKKIIPGSIEMLPYSKRHQATKPSETILVFFENDQLLYGYLNNLSKVTNELRGYYATCGFDISPCLNDPLEQQQMALLINILVNTHFLHSGIPVIPTLRTGDVQTFNVLRAYPTNIVFSLGSIGCSQINMNRGTINLTTKIYLTEPSEIISYGSLPNKYLSALETQNIPVKQFLDYRSKSFSRTCKKRLNAIPSKILSGNQPRYFS